MVAVIAVQFPVQVFILVALAQGSTGHTVMGTQGIEPAGTHATDVTPTPITPVPLEVIGQ
jgi:hypothetical protein